MTLKQAKILKPHDMQKVYRAVETSKHPVACRAMVDLSFFAGLRVGEIARLRTNAFLDASGEIDEYLTIFGDVAKMGRGRKIWIHPELRRSLEAFRKEYPELDHVAVGQKPGRPRTVNALTVWFWDLFKRAGFQGCSSHSGRRTAITNLARNTGNFNNSIRDVQKFAGHARLETTERYIEPSDNMAAMIASLGTPEPADQVVPLPRKGKRPDLQSRKLGDGRS